MEEEKEKSVEERIKEFDFKIEDAKANLGDVEIFEAILAKADFYNSIKDEENAIKIYKEAMQCITGISSKIDIYFKLLLIAMKHKELQTIKEHIEKVKQLLLEGGDWERKNRLKVYEGMHCIMIRDFKKGSILLLDSVITFSASELFSYKELIFYSVISGLLSLERPVIKNKIIHCPEVLAQIGDIKPGLKQFAESLYYCDYKRFMQLFLPMLERVRSDFYLNEHAKYFCKQMRVVAYAQFLEAYKSVKLQSMAEAFGISVALMDKELSAFIASGRIGSKIDKVQGIVHSNRPDQRIALYQRTIKEGDFLLNRIQKLSRALEL